MGTEERRDGIDAIVIGTGFAGAVTACRLVEAGFRVCVLERGRRYGPDDFPRYPTDELFADDSQPQQQYAPPPDFSRWLWQTDRGLYDVRDLTGAIAVQAAGYGGGSLIYANVHLRPPHDVFHHGWPEGYTGETLQPYYDLAAYMLGAMPIPQRLAKTLQLRRAAQPAESWFRTPLAVSFDGENRFGRQQNACDMRARCWRGCDRQAKNTLDLNYLARAEDGGCDIRTMAEVTCIQQRDETFIVHYKDLLLRQGLDDEGSREKKEGPTVSAPYVFLCAGVINTTELLFNCEDLIKNRDPLGSHYFPNADSLAVVFDCDEAHEPDYGPTITSALLYDRPSEDAFSRSLDFEVIEPSKRRPAAGTWVQSSSGGKAVLSHEPILDSDTWKQDVLGALALRGVEGQFNPDDRLDFQHGATGRALSSVIVHSHWFLVEDGGYSPDVEPLVGAFRSPLWLRRNRYLEKPLSRAEEGGRPWEPKRAAPLRRPPAGRLRVEAFADAVGATSSKAFASGGVAARTFPANSKARELLLPGLLEQQLETVFPTWFVKALASDRKELLEQAAAFALPMLGHLLDELSVKVATQIDPGTRARLSTGTIKKSTGTIKKSTGTIQKNGSVEDRQVEVLVRGLLRQVLQILAGSEVALATTAARAVLDPVPGTPAQAVHLLSNLALWTIGYDTTEGNTAVLLTMGRDAYRGRLTFDRHRDHNDRLHASLPTRLLDTVGTTHERVLREIVRTTWRGELRTNPGWTTLGNRITVHSQGGCPMGEPGKSITDGDGQVHDCPGLYIMDASAFPTSVGVNPSATIAAIAEYKIERFIRGKGHADWKARDHDDAQRWMELHGRAALDPLNRGGVSSRPEPANDVIGLSFTEELHGFFAQVDGDQGGKEAPLDLKTLPAHISEFVDAESEGIKNRLPIRAKLRVRINDLARLVSAEQAFEPVNLCISGTVMFGVPGAETRCAIVPAGSFLQIFLQLSKRKPLTRFFRYHVEFIHPDEGRQVLEGAKVLRNADGFDSWHDSSTVYFEITGGRRKRGVMRVSIETFLRKQLRSMKIRGTTDPARKMWALLAFYKYFVGELAEIYMQRSGTLKDLLFKLLTEIHV